MFCHSWGKLQHISGQVNVISLLDLNAIIVLATMVATLVSPIDSTGRQIPSITHHKTNKLKLCISTCQNALSSQVIYPADDHLHKSSLLQRVAQDFTLSDRLAAASLRERWSGSRCILQNPSIGFMQFDAAEDLRLVALLESASQGPAGACMSDLTPFRKSVAKQHLSRCIMVIL